MIFPKNKLSLELFLIKMWLQIEFPIICVYKKMIIEYTIQFKTFLYASTIKIKRDFNHLIVQDIKRTQNGQQNRNEYQQCFL